MEQTFHDLCRERVEAGQGLAGFVIWMFCETSVGIARENAMSLLTRNRSIVRIVLATALILMVPLVAMLFTDEVAWGVMDFVAAAVLLIGSGLTFDLIARRSRHFAYRIGVGVAVATGLLLVWINLAVGIIGSEDHPANLMYFAVLLVGGIGGILARFQPRGMSRALFVTAVAQGLVPVLALAIWQPPLTIGVLKVFVLSTSFAVLFAGSAFLFRHASRDAAEVQAPA